MIRLCGILAIAIGVAACEPKAAPEPATEGTAQGANGDSGIVEFELVRAEEAEGLFRLVNQSSEAISFRASQARSEGVEPLDAHLECRTAGSDQWDEGPRPMGDSGSAIIEVAPGSQEMLTIVWEPGLAGHYAGGACRVELRLQDGSNIESSEFPL